MAIVLVTGASGFVGSHVVPELVGGGHRVVALVRDRASGDAVMARLDADQRRSVELRTGDPVAGVGLAEALIAVDATVHFVAIARDRDDGKSLARVNVGGTVRMLQAARQAGCLSRPALRYVSHPHPAQECHRQGGSSTGV